MKKIVLECHSTDEFDDLIGNAVVHIDEALAGKILLRAETLRALKAADEEASCIEFAVGHVYFYEGGDEFEEVLAESDVVLIDDDTAPGDAFAPGEDVSTECDTLVVNEDDVWWSCYPKHGDAQVQTSRVTLKQIAEWFPPTTAPSL